MFGGVRIEIPLSLLSENERVLAFVFFGHDALFMGNRSQELSRTIVHDSKESDDVSARLGASWDGNSSIFYQDVLVK